MITASNKQVFPEWSEHFTGDVPTVADIAQGLGRMVRFCGQTELFYTVLTHVLVGEQLIEDEHRIHWLLHDAPEAIVSDVVTTWKSEEASENEAVLLASICHSLGITSYWGPEAVAAVKHVDLACLAAEAHALGHAQAERWWPRDQWGDLEARAFELTVDMLRGGAPMAYLNPAAAVLKYEAAIERALKVSSHA